MSDVDGTLLRVCGVGILCAVSGLLLHRQNGELSSLLRVAGGLLIMGIALVSFGTLPEEMESLLNVGNLREYATLMLKAVGIAVLCATCGEICRECGASGVAKGVELVGNLAILGLCLPLLQELIRDAAALLDWG